MAVFFLMNMFFFVPLQNRPRDLIAAQHRVCTWNTRMRTLGKHVLQVQVEVFHTVTTAAENGG